MDEKYVVIIQCDIAHNRCSGFACTNAFYNRDEVLKITTNQPDIFPSPVEDAVEKVLLLN